MLGVSPAFLRALGAAKLIEPKRSSGGHRRYSRYQLRLAARARELVDQGTPVSRRFSRSSDAAAENESGPAPAKVRALIRGAVRQAGTMFSACGPF